MRVVEIYFSPTGGTKKAADALCEGLSENIMRANITVSDSASAVQIGKDDLCVIGVPSFGGRVPSVAAKRISSLRGNGARAVLVCVYGNRAYEDTLVELEDAAKAAGFQVVAAVAAVAEHSIARRYAAGRPDKADQNTLRDFAAQILQKLQRGSFSHPAIPGHRPYKKSGSAGMIPKPDKNCTNCGICAKNCPVGAIDERNASVIDKAKCISCMRCVSVCPHGARKISPVLLAAVNVLLKKPCAARKECELFL